jgi:hypothetical protein
MGALLIFYVLVVVYLLIFMLLIIGKDRRTARIYLVSGGVLAAIRVALIIYVNHSPYSVRYRILGSPLEFILEPEVFLLANVTTYSPFWDKAILIIAEFLGGFVWASVFLTLIYFIRQKAKND